MKLKRFLVPRGIGHSANKEVEDEMKRLDEVIERCGDSLLIPIEPEAAATLRGISLEIARHSTTFIVGSVGSGKSTLLAALLDEVRARGKSHSGLCESGQLESGLGIFVYMYCVGRCHVKQE